MPSFIGVVLSSGRVVSGRPAAKTRRTSPAELDELTQRFPLWKEHIHMFRFRHVRPLLAERNQQNESDKSRLAARKM